MPIIKQGICILFMMAMVGCDAVDNSNHKAQVEEFQRREKVQKIQWRVNDDGVKYSITEIEGRRFVIYPGRFTDEIYIGGQLDR